MAADAPSTGQIEKQMAAGSLGFGALAMLAPRVFAAIYGLGSRPADDGARPAVGYPHRRARRDLAAGRSAESRRTLITVTTAMNAADAVLRRTASGVSTRSRVLGAASSGASPRPGRTS